MNLSPIMASIGPTQKKSSITKHTQTIPINQAIITKQQAPNKSSQQKRQQS